MHTEVYTYIHTHAHKYTHTSVHTQINTDIETRTHGQREKYRHTATYKCRASTSLAGQWGRTRLPTLETRVRSLVRECPTRWGRATLRFLQNRWTRTPKHTHTHTQLRDKHGHTQSCRRRRTAAARNADAETH